MHTLNFHVFSPTVYYAGMDNYGDSLLSHHFPTFQFVSCVGGKSQACFAAEVPLTLIVLERGDN